MRLAEAFLKVIRVFADVFLLIILFPSINGWLQEAKNSGFKTLDNPVLARKEHHFSINTSHCAILSEFKSKIIKDTYTMAYYV